MIEQELFEFKSVDEFVDWYNYVEPHISLFDEPVSIRLFSGSCLGKGIRVWEVVNLTEIISGYHRLNLLG